jgi:hypothetical protein
MNRDELQQQSGGLPPVELTGAPYLAGLHGKLAAQETAQ